MEVSSFPSLPYFVCLCMVDPYNLTSVLCLRLNVVCIYIYIYILYIYTESFLSHADWVQGVLGLQLQVLHCTHSALC